MHKQICHPCSLFTTLINIVYRQNEYQQKNVNKFEKPVTKLSATTDFSKLFTEIALTYAGNDCRYAIWLYGILEVEMVLKDKSSRISCWKKRCRRVFYAMFKHRDFYYQKNFSDSQTFLRNHLMLRSASEPDPFCVHSPSDSVVSCRGFAA